MHESSARAVGICLVVAKGYMNAKRHSPDRRYMTESLARIGKIVLLMFLHT